MFGRPNSQNWTDTYNSHVDMNEGSDVNVVNRHCCS